MLVFFVSKTAGLLMLLLPTIGVLYTSIHHWHGWEKQFLQQPYSRYLRSTRLQRQCLVVLLALVMILSSYDHHDMQGQLSQMAKSRLDELSSNYTAMQTKLGVALRNVEEEKKQKDDLASKNTATQTQLDVMRNKFEKESKKADDLANGYEETCPSTFRVVTGMKKEPGLISKGAMSVDQCQYVCCKMGFACSIWQHDLRYGCWVGHRFVSLPKDRPIEFETFKITGLRRHLKEVWKNLIPFHSR